MSTRGTKWCFTENNNADLFHRNLHSLYDEKKDIVRYICGQVEIAPGTGQRHFQGYIQLKKQQRLSWLKRNISNTAHWEPQRANDNSEARDYCNKEESRAPGMTFLEFGNFCEKRGKRTDLAGMRDAIKGGMGHRGLIDNFPNEYGRYSRFADRCMAMFPPPANPEKVEVILYHGEPGTGKTRRAYAENPDLYVSPIANGSLWLDGYDRQEQVLLDDFSGALSKWSLTDTLRLLDRYPVLVPVKGSFTWWVPKKIIVTTNIHPFNWYKWKGRKNQYQSLWRRFDQVFHFPAEGDAEEQDLETFFYDQELIWPPLEVETRPLPEAPEWVKEQENNEY